MFNKLITSFFIALQSVRRHMFHTLLSTLGVVIGVAALVTTLCLIDGVEKSIRETIAETISLQAISIESKTHERVNGIAVKKEKTVTLSPEDLQQLVSDIDGIKSAVLEISLNTRIYTGDDTTGATIIGLWKLGSEKEQVKKAAGRILQTNEKRNVAVVNKALTDILEIKPDSIIGKTLTIKEQEFKVIGVIDYNESSMVRIPYNAFKNLNVETRLPEATLQAAKFEEVEQVKDDIDNWLDKNYEGGSEAFDVESSKVLFSQLSQGMLFFKLFMGMIVGISVVVGGVGVMNVLLISVKERTKEIGIRKATGARKKDIVLQFLSESVAISTLGSLLGLIIGFLLAIGLAFVISQFAEMEFQAAFTWSTFAVVGVVALLVGVIFGTYPAMKAARLTPVDAIRYE